jgi:hypothetical protein
LSVAAGELIEDHHTSLSRLPLTVGKLDVNLVALAEAGLVLLQDR